MDFMFSMPRLTELAAMVQPWELRVTGADQTRLAKHADALGYDMIAIPEHHIVPRDHVPLSGAFHFHAIAAMGCMAGATERIRVNSCVSILPLQHPIPTAKSLATIDWLSSGRATVTFGVGWLAREFELMDVPFRERGRIADEYLAAIVELWTSDDPVFEGRYVSFDEVAFAPRPVQQPHLPIWIGGDADAALERAARFASGWFPFLTPPDRIGERLDFIKSQSSFGGGPFEVMYGLATSRVGEGHAVNEDPSERPGMSAQEIVDRIGLLAEQGVTMTSVPIPRVDDVEAYCDYSQWVIEEIRPKVA